MERNEKDQTGISVIWDANCQSEEEEKNINLEKGSEQRQKWLRSSGRTV